jgi:hypothetical protein
MAMADPLAPASVSGSKAEVIAAELKAWWARECADWDSTVSGTDSVSLPGGVDLWNDMPTVDSKAVARTSPIFERHLGVPLDVKLIRPGGYATIDDVITDLVPKMVSAVDHTAGSNGQGGKS